MSRLARDIAGLLAFLALCFATAGVGWLWTSMGLTAWYPTLNKPSWNPPNRVFGPVWTILYTAMAISAWLVWRRSGLAGARGPLLLFGLQLVLNAAWTGLFFALRMPALAFGEIVLLWLAILATIVAFARHSVIASLLLVPYLLWVSFAGLLNLTLWLMNV